MAADVESIAESVNAHDFSNEEKFCVWNTRDEHPLHKHRLSITCPSSHTYESFKATILSILTEFLLAVPDASLNVVVSTNSSIESGQSEQLFVTYLSNSAFSLEPCNQVPPVGPAKGATTPQHVQRSQIILGKFHSNCERTEDRVSCVLNVDSIALCRWDIPDYRLLLSTSKRVQDQLQRFDVTSSSPAFVPVSLHPPLWRHDVSFWQTDEKQADFVLQAVHETCGNHVTQVLIMNNWTEPGTGRTSCCYRLVYQSVDDALSRDRARSIQLNLRAILEKKYNIDLR